MATYSKITDKSNGNRPIQVESAIRDGDGKNIVNNYAKQNGNYQTMTVGLAENLTPYSDEAGTEQDIPFALQGTGCGNGETVVDTGSFAQLKEKQGNSVVVNQFLSTNAIVTNLGITTTVSGDVFTSSGTTASSYFHFVSPTNYDLQLNHKYIMLVDVVSLPTGISSMRLSFGSNNINVASLGLAASIITGNGSNNYLSWSGLETNTSIANFKYRVKCIDLTQWFGSNDNIPAYLLAHPESFFNYYRGSLAYNVGTLTDSNAQYLKTIGRNQWDEEWELGDLSSSTGAPVNSSTYIRSKNFNLYMPNTVYYVRANVKCYVFWYDANKNYISYTSGSIKNATTTSPSNACYYKITNNSSTYGNDITVSIYYDGESGYDQYYPYQVLTNVDTGNEVLRSAGSVKDTKEPSGKITRKIGTFTFTGSETWSFYDTFWQVDQIISDDNKSFQGAHCLLSNGIRGTFVSNGKSFRIYLTDNPQLSGSSNMNTLFPNGTTLNYELATPTTEQGTSFNETLAIDDFGSMMWTADDFNGVPQGNAIFYPVDYKAFVDTLTNYCDGDVNNLVLQSDLTTSESARDTIDAQLFTNAGGILRHLYAIKNNVSFANTAVIDITQCTSWSSEETEGGTGVFTCFAPTGKKYDWSGSYILCPKYLTGGAASVADMRTRPDMTIAGGGSNLRIIIKDSSLTGLTGEQAKEKLKGVLLAYEKA